MADASPEQVAVVAALFVAVAQPRGQVAVAKQQLAGLKILHIKGVRHCAQHLRPEPFTLNQCRLRRPLTRDIAHDPDKTRRLQLTRQVQSPPRDRKETALPLLKQSHGLKAQINRRIGRVERQGIQIRQQLLQTITWSLAATQAEHCLGLVVEKLQTATEVADQNPLFDRPERRRRIAQQLPTSTQAQRHKKARTGDSNPADKPVEAGWR